MFAWLLASAGAEEAVPGTVPGAFPPLRVTLTPTSTTLVRVAGDRVGLAEEGPASPESQGRIPVDEDEAQPAASRGYPGSAEGFPEASGERPGPRDLVRLEALLTEDHRLHPSARTLILDVEDGVDPADAAAVRALGQRLGYPEGVDLRHPRPPRYAGGGGWGGFSKSRPPPRIVPAAVALDPSGDALLTLADGRTTILRHVAIDHYTLACDATTCDLVAEAGGSEFFLGEVPSDALPYDLLFSRWILRLPERLNIPVPRTGALSPFAQRAGVEASGPQWPVYDDALVRDTLAERQPLLARCAARLHETAPDASGDFVATLTIAADGQVEEASLVPVLSEASFDACMRATLQDVYFPAPRQRVVVMQTLHVSP